MSPVDFSIQNLISGVNDIPEYLLKLAFDNPNNSYGSVWSPVNTEYSIEQGIREKVILKMVAPLVNVIGGSSEVLDLSGARITNMQGGHIPCFLKPWMRPHTARSCIPSSGRPHGSERQAKYQCLRLRQ